EFEPIRSKFNNILKSYSKELIEAFFVNKDTYNQIYSIVDFRNCKIWSVEKLHISLKFFLEDDENSIFIDLFPEIFLFVNEFKCNRKSSLGNLIQYDIFLNLIAFKFAYLKAMIAEIIKKESHNPHWLITDSAPLMSYIFELKCTFAIFAFNLLSNLKDHKLLIFRAFIVFLN
ncbi:hypothetical protein TUBRATIS_001310, partial [Tubulinosema ratisbonensis]